MSEQASEPSRIVCGLAGMVNFNPVASTIGASLASMAAHAAEGITAFDMGDIYPGVEEQAGAFLRQHFGTAAGAAAGRDGVRLLTKYVPNKKTLASSLFQASLPKLEASPFASVFECWRHRRSDAETPWRRRLAGH